MKRSGGAAGLFVLIGILSILAVTFAAGTYAGRIWATRPQVAAGPPAERDTARRGADPRPTRLAEPAPRLTFYQELTAPLTAPPPPPKPAKSSPPPLLTNGSGAGGKPALPDRSAAARPDAVVARDRTAVPEAGAGRDGATSASNRPPTPHAGVPAPAPASLASPATTVATSARFTIQVAAYRLRPPADALRATLTAAGHDARVVENDAANGVRFRVQVGDFASRDAAREAAARFTGPTFVTTR